MVLLGFVISRRQKSRFLQLLQGYMLIFIMGITHTKALVLDLTTIVTRSAKNGESQHIYADNMGFITNGAEASP